MRPAEPREAETPDDLGPHSDVDSVPAAPGGETPQPIEPDAGEPVSEPPAEPEPEPPAPPVYLMAESLSAAGPEGEIFSNVSVSAARGEIIALAGNSGTGRTAALLALSGRFIVGSGSLQVGGERKPSRIRRLVAVASASPAVVADENHTVKQLVEETALAGAINRSSVVEVCRLLGAHADSGATFGHLPKVDRTLLLLAFAAAHRTPVIAIDDVDHGVDSSAVARIWGAMRTLAAHDHLILATAVRPDPAADQVVRLDPAGAYTTGGIPLRDTATRVIERGLS